MSEDNFKVIYSGELRDGFEIESVAKSFATQFKIAPEKALKILQAGREITLNKKSKHPLAYKLKSAFEEIGMQVRLERILLLVSNEDLEDEENNKDKQEKPDKPIKDEHSEHTEKLKKASETWTLDPIKKEEDPLQSSNDDDQNNDTKDKDFNYTGLTDSPIIVTKRNLQDETDDSSAQESDEDESSEEKPAAGLVVDFLKRFGGVIAGGVIALVFILKKFGLFKLLKIGAIVAAASFAGFESEELCMGNSRCEEIIDEQLGICWEDKGYDDFNWDDMTDEEYWALKPSLETEVLACFIDTDTAQNVFVSPIEIRISIIGLCSESGIKNCEEIVEPQIKSCYDKYKLESYVDANTIDYYAVVAEYPKTFENFYACFVDEQGAKIIETDFYGL